MSGLVGDFILYFLPGTTRTYALTASDALDKRVQIDQMALYYNVEENGTPMFVLCVNYFEVENMWEAWF